jgi:hypothetical protein
MLFRKDKTVAAVAPPALVAGGPRAPRRGFTLLELLLAITALMLMVLTLALVFQQTHGTWGAGIRQAGTATTLRSVLGILERDLTHAVDATAFGLDDTFFNEFSVPMTFVTLDGTNRVPQVVKYAYNDGNLTRQTQLLTAGASAWSPGALNAAAIINGGQKLSSFQTWSRYATGHLVSSNLPLYVIMEVRAPKGSSFGVVSGWSEGRNRPGHPEDKIVANP